MRLKKFSAAIAVAAAAVTGLSGCALGQNGKTAYEKVQTALLNMQSYQAEASITYISNKTTHTYETLQQCRATGEYRIEVTGPDRVAGNVTINDGKVITQFNTRVAGKVSIGATEAVERSELFLTSFVKNYVKSQEVTVAAASIEGAQCTVLEAKIPGEHPYLSTEKLWVDNTTLNPVKLVIYDVGGAERVVVSYKTFAYNVSLNENLFKVE